MGAFLCAAVLAGGENGGKKWGKGGKKEGKWKEKGGKGSKRGKGAGKVRGSGREGNRMRFSPQAGWWPGVRGVHPRVRERGATPINPFIHIHPPIPPVERL